MTPIEEMAELLKKPDNVGGEIAVILVRFLDALSFGEHEAAKPVQRVAAEMAWVARRVLYQCVPCSWPVRMNPPAVAQANGIRRVDDGFDRWDPDADAARRAALAAKVAELRALSPTDLAEVLAALPKPEVAPDVAPTGRARIWPWLRTA